MRQQVPVDDVAKGLVDPDAILEYRQALRRAEQRRGRQSAKDDVLLKGVALGRADTDAVRVGAEEVGEFQRALPVEVAAAEGLDVGGNVLQWRTETGQRRRADHGDGRQLEHFGGIVARARTAQTTRSANANARQRAAARPPDASLAPKRQRIATPHGNSPTGISAIFVLVSVSITATALERPQAT